MARKLSKEELERYKCDFDPPGDGWGGMDALARAVAERDKQEQDKPKKARKTADRARTVEQFAESVKPVYKGRGGYRGGHRQKTLPAGARCRSFIVTDRERDALKRVLAALRSDPFFAFDEFLRIADRLNRV